MDGPFLWVVIGMVVHMLFIKRGGMGGMGCCGGHHDHQTNGPVHQYHHSNGDDNASPREEDNIIEIEKEDYKVLPSHHHRAHGESH